MNPQIIVKSKNGDSNTHGRIIVRAGTVKKEINAVVFSEKESIKLKEHIDRLFQSSL